MSAIMRFTCTRRLLNGKDMPGKRDAARTGYGPSSRTACTAALSNWSRANVVRAPLDQARAGRSLRCRIAPKRLPDLAGLTRAKSDCSAQPSGLCRRYPGGEAVSTEGGEPLRLGGCEEHAFVEALRSPSAHRLGVRCT